MRHHVKIDLLIGIVGLREHDILASDVVDWVMTNRDDDPNRSHLYTLMRELADAGLIEEEDVEEDSRAVRYRPTSEGIEELSELRDQLDEALDGFEPVEDEVEESEPDPSQVPSSAESTRSARAVGVAKDIRNHLAAVDGPITAQTALDETGVTQKLLAEALKSRSEWFELDGDMIDLSLKGREDADEDPFAGTV